MLRPVQYNEDLYDTRALAACCRRSLKRLFAGALSSIFKNKQRQDLTNFCWGLRVLQSLRVCVGFKPCCKGFGNHDYDTCNPILLVAYLLRHA